jgi:predicted AAA+ superfamily ATPase
VGLASYLLGAEAVQHISRHPLRGNLFENLVVGEALKYRYNRGKRSNLFFWRDAKGNEVDLVVDSADRTCCRWKSRPARPSARITSGAWTAFLRSA